MTILKKGETDIRGGVNLGRRNSCVGVIMFGDLF